MLGKGRNIEIDLPWERRVSEEAMLFDEYGVPFDLRSLPMREYQAHLAIVAGKQEARKEEHKKAEREANQAS